MCLYRPNWLSRGEPPVRGTLAQAPPPPLSLSFFSPSQDAFLRGKGTLVSSNDGQLVASVCGVVERVNKLVTVRPLRSRYTAHAGDVVVGRVVEIQGKRWKLDINSIHEARLELSAVYVPGEQQRRHTIEDELGMRKILREGDLVVAEVQSVFHDGSVCLQTRSTRFGLLRGGQVVQVPPNLVKRQKQHMDVLRDIGVGVVQGVNGLIFVHPELDPKDIWGAGARSAASSTAAAIAERDTQTGARAQGDRDVVSAATAAAASVNNIDLRKPSRPATGEEHARVARVCAAIQVLAHVGALIYPASILDVYHTSEQNQVTIPDMVGAAFLEANCLLALERLHAK